MVFDVASKLPCGFCWVRLPGFLGGKPKNWWYGGAEPNFTVVWRTYVIDVGIWYKKCRDGKLRWKMCAICSDLVVILFVACVGVEKLHCVVAR